MAKCADCGHLAVRGYDGEFREVEELSRRPTGSNFQVLCFVRLRDFRHEFADLAGRVRTGPPDQWNAPTFVEGWDLQRYYWDIIGKEIECAEYIDWRQGFTPKEHRERLDRQAQLLQQERRDRDLRDWQETQRRQDRRWRIIELVVLGLLATLLAGGFTILGAFIQRG